MKWLQQWNDVLFVHVPVAPDELRRHVAGSLEIDTYDGQAYISLVCFRLKLRPAGLPYIPALSSLLEVNVRTYVRCREMSGITFLRMYADNRLAVAAARLLTPLCYEPAKMKGTSATKDRCSYSCRPVAASDELAVEYTIAGPAVQPDINSLEAWLVERYTLFVDTPAGVIAADVTHPPWQISPVDVHSVHQTLTDRFASSVGNCLLHHSPGVAAEFHAFQALGRPSRQDAVIPARATVHCAGQ
jgi:uncharacterized protein YqjF (DUF2071 family)